MDTISNIVKRLRENRLRENEINYAELDHDDLIKLAQQEDQQAFEELLRQYDNLIQKQSRKYFLDNGNAGEEDMYQIASIGFWEAVKSYNPSVHKHGFGAYANMIIGRKFADLLRKEDTDKRKLNNFASSMEDPIGDDGEGGEQTLGDIIASDDGNPEDTLIGEEGVRELMRFMKDKFSEREREVVRRRIAGQKTSDIAEEMGMGYKSVENTLMRIKNKLNDYLKSSKRESKKIRRDNDVKFSDEEKKILENVLNRIDQKEALRESNLKDLTLKYRVYTEGQLDKELDRVEDAIESLIDELRSTPYESDERDELLDYLDDLRTNLLAMEDYLTDEQLEISEKLMDRIRKASDTEYQDPHDTDDYEDRFLRKSEIHR